MPIRSRLRTFRRALVIPGRAAFLLLAACATEPRIDGAYVSELELDQAAPPRQLLAQACVSDWCPFVRPELALELGCP